MTVLIDYDSSVYALASACDNATWNYRGRSWETKAIAIKSLEAEGKDPKELTREINPEPWDKVEYTVNKYTDSFLENFFDYTILISGGGGNFRYDVATILPYKGNRIQDLPYHFNTIKDYLVDVYQAKKVYHVEVDDAIGILYNEGDLLVHTDKDLNQFPGRHFNPTTKTDYTVSEIEGIRNLYTQVLIGDKTDNVLGVYGVGSSSAYVKQIASLDNEFDILELVREIYYSRFGSYYPSFLLENMRLVYLIQKFKPLPIIESDCLDFYNQNWEEKIFIKDAI